VQQLAERRRRQDGRFKLARQPDLRDSVGKSLAMGHSPEQIAGRLAREHGHVIISMSQSIVISSSYSLEGLLTPPVAPTQAQARPPPAPRRQSRQLHQTTAPKRPAEVEDREVPGHWEADFMLFARYGQGLLVLHERQTRFNMVQQPVDRKAVLTALTIARQLGKLPQAMRKTISFDNGTEFAEHHRLHKTLGVETFFCDPHSPWQKGGVEHSIGRLRRSLPRKTDLNLITAIDLKRSIQRLRYPTQMPGLQDTRRGILQTQINRCT
jgi:IS30 family transposase